MANHCNNRITFTGKNITKLKKDLESSNDPKKFVCLISHFFPKSEKNIETVYEDYGTKWLTLDSVELETDDTELTLMATSAWAPPIGWVKKIAKRYKLQADGFYHEGGMDIAGRYDTNGLDIETDTTESLLHEDLESYINDLQGMLDDVYTHIKDNPEDTLQEHIDFLENKYVSKQTIKGVYNSIKRMKL